MHRIYGRALGRRSRVEFYNKVKKFSRNQAGYRGELKVSVFTEDGTRPVEMHW